MKRYAFISLTWERDNPAAYMPGNYHVIYRGPDLEDDRREVAVLMGEDSHGWTLDDYVLPRLASGGMPGREIDLSHPIMKLIPETPGVGVWFFTSTGEAYDVSQCDDRIQDGDILAVPSEGVVGVLIKAWPVAATPEAGKFHAPMDGFDWANVEGDNYTRSHKGAEAWARMWA